MIPLPDCENSDLNRNFGITRLRFEEAERGVVRGSEVIGSSDFGEQRGR